MMNDMAKEGDIKGTGNKKLVPELRFLEFEKDWDVDSMQSIFDMKNGYTPSKSNPTYWDNGTIPWFRMEDIRKNGHILSDSIQHVTQQAVKNSGLFPAYSIIVATTATIGEHALIIVDSLANQRFTFLTKRKSFKDKINMIYFHHYMFIIDEWCKKNTNSGGLVSVNIPAFKQLLIPFPSPAEQQKIAECLSSIDEEISALKEKVEQLKVHKKGLMQKLFPVAGKFVPELRFPEFKKESEWKEMTLGEVFERVSEKNVNNNQNVLTISAQYGLVSQYDYFNKNVAATNVKSYYFIHKGDFAYNKSRSQGYPFGVIKPLRRYDSGVVSTLYICFRAKTNCCIDFYEQYFDTDLMNNEISKIAQEGARNHGLLNILVDDFFNKIKILVPHSSEQKNIAENLASIDELISLYEKKVILLEQHKKGLMQQLFPKL